MQRWKTNERRDRGTRQLKPLQSHRRDRSVDPLGNAERQVDAQHIIRIESVGGQGVQGRNGPRLGQPELIGGIDSPLGILWRPIVSLDLAAECCKGAYLRLRETGLVAAISELDALCATTWNGLNCQ